MLCGVLTMVTPLPCCAGVTIGSVGAVLAYVSQLLHIAANVARCSGPGAAPAAHQYMVHRLGPTGNLTFSFHVRENWASPLHSAGERRRCCNAGRLHARMLRQHCGRRADAADAEATPTLPTSPCVAAFGWPAVIDRQGVYRRESSEGEAPPVVLQYGSTPRAAEVRRCCCCCCCGAPAALVVARRTRPVGCRQLPLGRSSTFRSLPSPLLQIFLSMYPLGPAPRVDDIRWEGPSCTEEGVALNR